MTKEKADIQIPGHRILRQLGSGGMANVYLAFQESMEREVALKIMHPSLGLTDPAFSERFVREAKIIAKLSHPHINAVYDVAVAGGYHYFTMEYLTGGDLKSRIRKGMPPKAALAIVRQVAGALAFAHSKGYVHRDVKPENVLFRDSGTAVLTDFGIAKANDNSMTATGTIIGTPHYMSPEQAMGRAMDKRSDLYSLGAMLYQMFTGKVPYTGDSAVSIGIRHVKDPVPQLPPPLHAYQPLLDKFLAKNPAHRFQTGEEVIAAIDALARGANMPDQSATGGGDVERTVVLSGTASAPTMVTGAGQAKRRRGMLVVAALLVPLIAAAVFLKVRKPADPAPVAAAAVAPADSAPSAAAVARAAEIAQLLAEADSAARAGRYFEPVATAAVPKLRRVLELEPANAQAARALTDIAGRLITRAERAIETKNFEHAEALLKQAEAADPGHPMLFSRRLALTEFRQRQAARAASSTRAGRRAPAGAARPPVAEAPQPTLAAVEDPRARASREREQKLERLLSRFRSLTAAGSFSAERARLAQAVMADARRLAPDDRRVATLPDQLADAYFKLAAAKAEAREYQEAGALVRRGLDVRPDHRPLQALQQDLIEKRDARRQTFGSF